MTGQANLVRRRDAAQATLDTWLGKPFAWGEADCARMAAGHLRQLGYKPRLSRFGRYSTALGAAKALRRGGFDDLGQVLDDLGLIRIGHASHLVGDIFGLVSEPGWIALGVALGNGRVLAFNPHDNCGGVVQPPHDAILACWRADPWPMP